jgi:hypothetical protein
MRRALPPSTPAHLGVFTTHTAYAHGWTAEALAHAVRREWVVRLARGVYVGADDWSGTGPEADRKRLAMRTVSATLLIPAAAASHISAAILAELPTWELPSRPCITLPPRSSGDARCSHQHRAALPVEHLVPDAAVRRTRAARTVLDIAREHGVEDAVTAGDSALRQGLTDPDRLVQVAQFCATWPGIRRARRVLELLDPRAESPLESVSRIRIGATSLPTPEPQVEIFDHRGVFLSRPDFFWEEFGVAGEVDGKQKYSNRPDEVRWREKKRQESTEDTGVIFVRWGRPDLENMVLLQARIERVLARAESRPVSARGWIARRTEPRFRLLGTWT